MRRRRTLAIIVALLVIGLAITAAVLLRMRSAPEAARLLPEADTYLYFNLAPLRAAGVFNDMPAVSHEAEYEEFLRATGFQFERDLDEAAFAVHAPSPPRGETRFSEVLVGRFDLDRARAYLRKLAARVDAYRDREIFSIPLEGRTVRAAILGVGMVAVSNVDDAQVIRGMVDRYKHVALPLGGPALLRENYARVPWASLAWAIARVAPTSQGNRAFVLPGGYEVFFPGGTVIVASARYVGEVQLKAEAITGGTAEKERLLDQLNAFLALFRNIESNTDLGGSDKDVKAFFDSVKLDSQDDKLVLSATAPPGFFRKLVREGPETTIAPPSPPEQKPAPKPKTKQRRK